MFRAVPLPIIRSSFTVHLTLVCHTGLKTAFEQGRDGPARTKLGNQINDKLTIQSNPIFEVLVQHELTQRTATSHIESESYDIKLTSNPMYNIDSIVPRL